MLRRFRLEGKRDVPFGRLSRGMKRGLTVGAALVHRPWLVFLDEPTSGLDVVNGGGLRTLIERLCDDGVTILLTTHYLKEAGRLADRVALVVNGCIVASDTVEGLKGRVANGDAMVEIHYADATGPDRVGLHGEDGMSAVRGALDRAEAAGREVVSINKVRPSLEDAFIELTSLSAEVILAEEGGEDDVAGQPAGAAVRSVEGHADLVLPAAQHQLGDAVPGRPDPGICGTHSR